MSLTDEQKKQLAKLASADYGIPGAGYDSLEMLYLLSQYLELIQLQILNSLRQLLLTLPEKKDLMMVFVVRDWQKLFTWKLEIF